VLDPITAKCKRRHKEGGAFKFCWICLEISESEFEVQNLPPARGAGKQHEAQNSRVGYYLLHEAQNTMREAQLAEARFDLVQILWKISFWRISDLNCVWF
jgi:hypothetical protein